MKVRLIASIFFFLIILSVFLIKNIFTSSDEEYTKFPLIIKAEDSEEAGKTGKSVYDKKISGEYTGKGFAYLQDQTISFNVTIPEDGMYQFIARMAQILDEDGRQQTISINGIDYMYKVPYNDSWTDWNS